MIILKNERLKVQIQEPGSRYQRARFDWSGICQQIRLDDAAQNGHTFCAQEATTGNRGTEGVGLTDEFGIETPIGYHEIPVGAWFPKIGVGFLQKVNDDPYSFVPDYPIQPAPIKMEQAGDAQVIFLQQSNMIGGWGWNLRKTVSIHQTTLRINYVLENTGEKPLITEQYNHNFIAVNSCTTGPDYQLQTSFPLNCAQIDGGIQTEEEMLRLTEVPSSDIYCLQSDCAGLQNVVWTLTHRPTGHGVRVKEQFPLFKFALWAKSHVISPEFFIWINLEPGEIQTWQREYTFF